MGERGVEGGRKRERKRESVCMGMCVYLFQQQTVSSHTCPYTGEVRKEKTKRGAPDHSVLASLGF